MNLTQITHFFSKYLLSKKSKRASEVIIVSIAILSFIAHLTLILLARFHILHFSGQSALLTNPMAAIYTPFSFILTYEVYLLVYYLPKSTSIYIGKQYEIITLIVIRRIFKDLSHFKLDGESFQVSEARQLLWSVLATITLFFLIFLFYQLNQKRITSGGSKPGHDENVSHFIQLKILIAGALIPVFTFLGFYSFGYWFYANVWTLAPSEVYLTDLNKIFFDDFFTILILIDVLLLLLSFIQSDRFHKVIRNSGFIVSTVLIKLSFGVAGSLTPALLVGAVLFGVIILKIHNLFEGLVYDDEK
jgi:hypothetical protein